MAPFSPRRSSATRRGSSPIPPSIDHLSKKKIEATPSTILKNMKLCKSTGERCLKEIVAKLDPKIPEQFQAISDRVFKGMS